MIKKFTPKSEFNRNVLTLMTGTTIAQAIPIAITPILTRIYTPEDFGVLALFVSITVLIGSVSSGRYELAIMKPLGDSDAVNIAAAAGIIVSTIAVVSLLLVVLFGKELTDVIGNKEIFNWLYFVPITVFLTGWFNILTYLNNRKKLYKDIAISGVYKSTAMGATQVSVGLSKLSMNGLILGHIVSFIFGNIKLLNNAFSNYNIKASLSISSIRKMAVKYKKFPQYTMLAGLANATSTQGLNILISGIYNVAILGFYSLVQRILEAPSSLIGRSIGQVFYEKSTVEFAKTGEAIKVFKSTLWKLIYISTPIFLIMYFSIEDIFIFAFGGDWAVAGVYAKIMTPLFFVRFIVVPLLLMNVIYNKNEVGLYWQIGLLLMQLLIIFIAQINSWSFEIYLHWMTYIISAHYLLILWIVSRYKNQEVI
jgi:O-antigen/teichoic acid export membrane protein